MMNLKFYPALVVYTRDKDGSPKTVRFTGRMYCNEADAKEDHGRDFIRLCDPGQPVSYYPDTGDLK
jgi:hypothetical protein